MKKNKKIAKKKFFFILIFFSFMILFFFGAIIGYSNFKKNTKNIQDNAADSIDQRISSIIFEINNFPSGIGDDILFLSELSSIKKINNNQTTKDFEEDLIQFMQSNGVYYQLNYFDNKGKQIIGLEFDGQGYNKLYNQNGKNNFEEIDKLGRGELFISPLELNIKNGEIENRGTKETPIYVPILNYITPIFENENKKGMLTSKIYANYFLEDIRRAQRDGEKLFLINQEGYYLAHPNKSKEFSHLLNYEKSNFYNDYKEINNSEMKDGRKKIETDNLTFNFRYIYPTISSFEIYEGSNKILGEESENKYYWILISVSDKTILNKATESLKQEYLLSLLFYGLAILIIFILMTLVNRFVIKN